MAKKNESVQQAVPKLLNVVVTIIENGYLVSVTYDNYMTCKQTYTADVQEAAKQVVKYLS